MPEANLDHARLSQLDLNLLVALDAIHSTGSVTKAAARLQLNQSSLSHQLARLRELFGDELFVRSNSGVSATPRGTAIAKAASDILRLIAGTLLNEAEFSPATASRVFRLGIPDYLESILVPPLAQRCQDAAPNVRLELHSLERQQATVMLDKGEIDAAVGNVSEGGMVHKRKILFEDHYVCLHHPRLLEQVPAINAETYFQLPHVAVDLKETACRLVDETLAQSRLSRKIAVTTPHAHAIPALVASSSTIATVPRMFAEAAAKTHDLTISPLPFRVDPFQISLVWHTSSDADAGIVWFRRVIAETAQSLARSSTSKVTTTRSVSRQRPSAQKALG